MTSYVLHTNGWWVVLYNDVGTVIDYAVPFDDEYDAEMAQYRIDRVAA